MMYLYTHMHIHITVTLNEYGLSCISVGLPATFNIFMELWIEFCLIITHAVIAFYLNS